ncbi:Probable nitrate/nitrite antiporter NarK2 [Seminavis robusta]|uniref:Probable nitrate/nitrite antiporter NarK2 n=1 Tax=Seminavis robusta TaxID=568900 RepID=A0A9N8EMR5_9STRA|nr:Probable nitrate/nitrite antiporter NarK2 [Seminavis robusta]|eukprot:Sro1430_g271940.1 Probable nitrate/nitrite antiporter NarK2 (678) ;mRNA; r:8037-10429
MSNQNGIALIGRGESVLTGASLENLGRQRTELDDSETAGQGGLGIRQDCEGGIEDGENVALLADSSGWIFPQVKLTTWNPEDEKQWTSYGSSIARRNLIASIPNLTCSFGVWLVWSVIATRIQKMHDADPEVYPFQDWESPQGKDYKALLFLLPAIAGLSGGTLRIPNSFLTQVAGGRNVVYSTSVILCIPMIISGIALGNPRCPFNLLIVCSLLSGAGGGAFASSMSNISFYYPKKQQGYALGMNGGLGNLGVSISQLLAPIFMTSAFGSAPVSPNGASGWPANAGWLWFPLCAASAIFAYFYMSNQPTHGSKSQLMSHVNFYWMEIVGFIAASIGCLTLVFTRDSAMVKTSGGQVAHKFLLVLLAASAEHIFLWYITPKKAKVRVHKQVVIFKNKHTYIMTWLYIMCFGSFIGYSGSFPKLIVDLFGYVNGDGCKVDGTFTPGGEEAACLKNGGEWLVNHEYVNPNAPNSDSVAWLGAAVGSLIRPVGGVLADKFGGARCTMVAIIWCTIAAFCQGILVKKTRDLDRPEENFGWFVFLFLNLFLTTGFMNGTTFRTIGVLFPPEESGPVLGWSSAIASYGAFIIPTMFGIAIKAGSPEVTFYGLGAYYVTCAFLNFWYYLRPGCEEDLYQTPATAPKEEELEEPEDSDLSPKKDESFTKDGSDTDKNNLDIVVDC